MEVRYVMSGETMQNGKLGMLVQCRWCNNTFPIGVVGGAMLCYQREYKSEDGRSIFLTHYDCPECGKRHFVQADDDRSREILAGVTRLLARIAAAKAMGKKSVPIKRRDEYNKRKNYLSEYRMCLMREWSGCVVTEVATGSVHTLEFSV